MPDKWRYRSRYIVLPATMATLAFEVKRTLKARNFRQLTFIVTPEGEIGLVGEGADEFPPLRLRSKRRRVTNSDCSFCTVESVIGRLSKWIDLKPEVIQKEMAKYRLDLTNSSENVTPTMIVGRWYSLVGWTLSIGQAKGPAPGYLPQSCEIHKKARTL